MGRREYHDMALLACVGGKKEQRYERSVGSMQVHGLTRTRAPMTTACSFPVHSPAASSPSSDLTTAALSAHSIMAAPAAQYKYMQFLAVIGDEVGMSYSVDARANRAQDTCTGMLLAGVGVSYYLCENATRCTTKE